MKGQQDAGGPCRQRSRVQFQSLDFHLNCAAGRSQWGEHRKLVELMEACSDYLFCEPTHSEPQEVSDLPATRGPDPVLSTPCLEPRSHSSHSPLRVHIQKATVVPKFL